MHRQAIRSRRAVLGAMRAAALAAVLPTACTSSVPSTLTVAPTLPPPTPVPTVTPPPPSPTLAPLTATPSPAATATPSPPLATATPVAAAHIETPEPGARVTLPLHILARGGQPGAAVRAVLRWQDGAMRSATLPVLRGADGAGLVIGTPPWWPDMPPQPGTQPAALHLYADDRELGRQSLIVLGPDDADTQAILLFWLVAGTERIEPETRRIVRTVRVGTAALEELLWGPPLVSNIGYRTAIPTPEEVLRFPGREPDWGPRVTLRGLTITDGVALADFSKEMRAYGGGSLRVWQIVQQIRQTLLQFPTVQAVQIAIEGETEGVLEP